MKSHISDTTDKENDKKSPSKKGEFAWRSEPKKSKKVLSKGISPKAFHRQQKHRPGSERVERMHAQVNDSLLKEGKRNVGKYREIQRSAFRQITRLRSWPLQARAFSSLDELMMEYLQEDSKEYIESAIHEAEDSEPLVSSSSAFSGELEPKRVMRDVLTSPAKSRLKGKCQVEFLVERSLRRPVPITHKWSPSLWSLEPRVFSTEKSGTGKRNYVVGHLGRFLDMYWRKTDPFKRHFYELIRENTPCRLYLDLEFSKISNPDILPVETEGLLNELFTELSKEFATNYDLELRLERCHIVDLDSSTNSKFSRHWIVHVPGYFLFANTGAMGQFMRAFVGRLAEEQATGQLKESRPLLHQHLMVNVGPSKTADKNPFQKTCVIDLGVYTRNRLFRLLGSSKFGKPVTAALRIADANQFRFPNSFGNHCFHPPAMRNLVDGEEPALQKDENTSSGREDDDELAIAIGKFIAKMDWTDHAESLALTLVVPANGSKIAYPVLPYDDECAGKDVRSGATTISNRLPAQNAVLVGPSPFPVLDDFVRSHLASRGGTEGSIRAWSIERNPENGVSNLITFQMSRNRYCECVGRHHKSNNIYWIVSFTHWHAVQGCHDPECRLMNFRGQPVDLPEPVVESVREVLFEEELALLDDQALVRPSLTSPNHTPIGTKNTFSRNDLFVDDAVDASFERALLALNLDDGTEGPVPNNTLTPSSQDDDDERDNKPSISGRFEDKILRKIHSSDSDSSSGRSALLALARKQAKP